MTNKKETLEETKISQSLVSRQLEDLIEIQKFSRQIARRDFFTLNMSPNINELTQSLTIFKLELPSMRTDKSAGGRYNYQSLNTLLTITGPILAKNNLVVSQPIQTIGTDTYVVTIILHTSNQFLRSVTLIPKQYLLAGKMASTSENLHALGGAITYLKRYAYKSILGIDADDDTDGN